MHTAQTSTRSLRELMNLQGRVALVTGAGGQLGPTFAEALAELGAAVAVLDIAADACRHAAEDVAKRHGVETLSLAVDVTDGTRLRAVPEDVVRRLGRLDILVNGAAVTGSQALAGWSVPFLEQHVETWQMALEVNLTAAFVLTQASAQHLAASGHGSVINLASIYGMSGPDMGLYEGTSLGNPAAYAASKGGLLQLTRWLATVLAPSVRVNAISPGGVWRDQPDAFRIRYEDHTPLRRMASAEDLKGAIAYLASDLSAYVTGHNLVVDGGWTVW